LLRDHFDTMTQEERGRFLANADEAASRLDRLVRRLLELARADVAGPSEAASDLRVVVKALTERYGRTSLRVNATVADDARGVAMSGEILDEILTNLIDNARQHGGDTVTVRIEARKPVGPGRPAVEVIVEDDGPGVSDGNLSRIFTPFFTTARERGGSGLGLSIVKSLLEAHGGTIGYLQGRRGAAFRLTIPARR